MTLKPIFDGWVLEFFRVIAVVLYPIGPDASGIGIRLVVRTELANLRSFTRTIIVLD